MTDHPVVISPVTDRTPLDIDESERTVVLRIPVDGAADDRRDDEGAVDPCPDDDKPAVESSSSEQTIVLPATGGGPAPSSLDPDSAGGLTRLIPAVPKDPPVFVDATGRRRRRLRLMAYGLAAAGLIYTALVGISFTGVTVSPESVLPFLGGEQAPAPAPTPGGGPVQAPEPTPAASMVHGTPESARASQSPT